MDNYLIWMILALILLGCEMMVGTIYLLAFVAGCAVACFIAFITESVFVQCLTAAFVSVLGVILAIVFRKKIRSNLTPNKECDDLDKGQIINVEKIENDGSSTVSYRGSQWKAFARDGALEPGLYHIEKVEGTRLILTK